MDQTASPRAARAALIGAALVVLTLVGHAAGHGALDIVGVGVVSLLAIGFGAALSARRLTPRLVLGVLLAGQLLLHVVLTFTSAHHAGASSISTPFMVAGHVVAAVVATGVVLQADALVRAWRRFLTSVLGGAARTTHRPAGQATPVVPAARAWGHLPVLLHIVVRRGPPLLAAFA